MSPVHTNPQVMSVQRYRRASHKTGASEITAGPPSPFIPTISHLFSLLQAVNPSCLFTRCQPLGTSSCTALLNFSRHCAERLKVFSLFLRACSLCIICIKSVIALLQYSTIQPIVLVGFLGYLCWTFTNELSEGNPFIWGHPYWACLCNLTFHFIEESSQ